MNGRRIIYELAEIKTYDDMVEWFARARKPDEGRPFKSWARVYRSGDEFHIKFGEMTVAVMTPDNILTFPLTPSRMRHVSQTFSSSSYRAIPIMFQRLATGRYSIAHTKEVDNRPASCWAYMKDGAPEYFQGIKFDLVTGECINKRPRITDSINKDARKEWLSKLRKFKQGMKLRAKLGVLQTLCQQVVAERSSDRSSWQQPDWTSDYWSDRLYEAIRDEQFPTEVLKGFVMASRVSYWRNENPTPQHTLEAMEGVLDILSVELRRKFGVFELEAA